MRGINEAADRMVGVERSEHSKPDVSAVRRGVCPLCLTKGRLMEGPSGGMSTNVECAACGSEINVTHGFDGAFRVDILKETAKAGPMRDAVRAQRDAESNRLNAEIVEENRKLNEVLFVFGALVILLVGGLIVFARMQS